MKRLFLLALILLNISSVQAAIKVDYADGIYHAVLTGDKVLKQVNFISTSNLKTNREVHNSTKSLFTINAGFFDPKNQKSISYVVNDYQTIEDPLFNEGLTQNPVLRRSLKKILNRTELRVLDCDGKLKYEIAEHNSKIDFLCSVKTSAQGGPQLLPNLRLEEEAFIVKDKGGNVVRESASVLHKTPRTLVGIKSIEKGAQELHVFIVTNESPMDIYECRELCLKYGLDSAMAFDGGSSTSMNYKNIQVISTQDSGDTGRALKSFMILKK